MVSSRVGQCGNFADASIAAKELLPIVIAAAIWGKAWKACTVQCNCDNAAVVGLINSGSCKEKWLSHLLRCLFFIEARHSFTLVASHVPGALNHLADALSRNNAPLFLVSTPQASHFPTPVPKGLLQVLVHQQPDWMSPAWVNGFTTICSSR